MSPMLEAPISAIYTKAHNSPGLAFLKPGLHVLENSVPTWFHALQDSGCSDNLISLTALQTLTDFDKVQVSQSNAKTIRTANNDCSQVIFGKTMLYMSFMAENGKRITILTPFYVVSGLVYQVFIGQPFLTSPVVHSENPRYLMLQLPDHELVFKIRKLYKSDILLKCNKTTEFKPFEKKVLQINVQGALTDIFDETVVPYIEPDCMLLRAYSQIACPAQFVSPDTNYNILVEAANLSASHVNLPSVPIARLCFEHKNIGTRDLDNFSSSRLKDTLFPSVHMNIIRNTNTSRISLPTSMLTDPPIIVPAAKTNANKQVDFEQPCLHKNSLHLLPKISEEDSLLATTSQIPLSDTSQSETKTTICQENLNSREQIPDGDNLQSYCFGSFGTDFDIFEEYPCECTHSFDSFVSCHACLNDTSDFPLDKVENSRRKRELARQGYTQQSVTEAIMARETPGFEGTFDETDVKVKSTEELIDECKLSHLSPKTQELVKDMLTRNIEAFQKHALDIGMCKYVTAEATLTMPNPPVTYAKYIPVPFKYKEACQKLIDDYVKAGVFAPTTRKTTFVSNVFVIPKKNNTFRLIIDGRVLSNYCQPLPLALGNLEEIFADLGGKEFVTVLDVSKAYDQLPVSEKTSYLLSFFGPDAKRYIYKRAGQGLKFSSYFLIQAMEIILHGLPSDQVKSYCDDVYIATSGNFRLHIELVEIVIQRFAKSGMKLNLAKLEIAPATVEFLGHIWKPGYISIPAAKLTAYSNMRAPKTKNDIQFVINSLSFYRNFIPNFSEHIHPIRMMIVEVNNKKSKFYWTEEMQKGLQAILDGLAASCTRFLPRHDRPFIIKTDASKFAAAAIICQYDDLGDLQLVAAVSRSFTSSERALAPVHKEILTLTYTLSSMEYILRGAALTIFADAKSLIYVKTCSGSSDYLTRLAMILSKHDFELHHVAGRLNIEADALSRLHKIEDRLKQSESTSLQPMTREESLLFLEYLTVPDSHTFTVSEVKALLQTEPLRSELQKRVKQRLLSKLYTRKNLVPSQVPYRLAKMPRLTKTHPLVTKLNNLVHSRPTCNLTRVDESLFPHLPPVFRSERPCFTNYVAAYNALLDKTFDQTTFQHCLVKRANLSREDLQAAQTFDRSLQLLQGRHGKSYIVKDGLVCKKVRSVPLPVLPRSIQTPLILSLHYHALSGHRSPAQILALISKYYYADNLKETIKKLVADCFICHQVKAKKTRKPFLAEITKPEEPRQMIAFDIFAGLPDEDGYKFVYVFIDEFSLYVTAYPMKTKTTDDLISAFLAHFAHQSFLPTTITSDNEPGLMTQRFKDFVTILGVTHKHGAPHSAWTNLAESGVYKIKEALRANMKSLDCSWREALWFATIAINHTPIWKFHTPADLQFAAKGAPDLLNQEIRKTLGNPPTGNSPAEAPSAIDSRDFDRFSELSKARAKVLWESIARKRAKENSRRREAANRSRAPKAFKKGELVWLEQLNIQQNRALADKYLGPYTIHTVYSPSIYSLAEISTPTIEARLAHAQHLEPFHNVDPRTQL